MRTCKKCLQQKELNEFKKHTHGHRYTCKTCQYQAMRLNPTAHANAIKRNRKWRATEKGQNTEKKYAQSIFGRQSRATAIKKYEQTTGKASKIARTAARRAAQMQRTPVWLTDIDRERIVNEYRLAVLLSKVESVSWTVDHRIPLQGKLVSGLHVPGNLQVMRASENYAKRNKFEVSA